MSDLKELMPSEYAKLRGVTPVAVTRALKKGKKLVGVKYYNKVRRDWVLLVDLQAAKKKPKNYLVISE